MSIDICIRGAGIVGQTLALLLARARIRVGLVNHRAVVTESADIRSFALNAASRQMLMDLRAWPDEATPVQQMQVFGDKFEDKSGSKSNIKSGSTGQVSFAGQASAPLAWIVDAALLEERLRAAVSFAPEISLLKSPEPAQLTVITEGRSSSTRQATGAPFEQFAYDQCAIAAHITCEKPHQNTAWQWMQGGEICALLPRGGSEGGEASSVGNSAALVWSVSESRAKILQHLPDDEFNQQLEQATQSQLGKLKVSPVRASWPLMLAQAQQWCGQADFGAWALAGDAAHAVHPLAGQGLNLGLGDARELAQLLSDKPSFRTWGDTRLLRAYERARKGEAAMLRLATDGLQRMFSAQDARIQGLRNWGMRSFDAAAPLKDWLMRQASGLR
jgi:2-polyprenyl-6-methoxyphenol hydroxylase-like FAD-dependent oxidoreductase